MGLAISSPFLSHWLSQSIRRQDKIRYATSRRLHREVTLRPPGVGDEMSESFVRSIPAALQMAKKKRGQENNRFISLNLPKTITFNTEFHVRRLSFPLGLWFHRRRTPHNTQHFLFFFYFVSRFLMTALIHLFISFSLCDGMGLMGFFPPSSSSSRG